MFTEMDYHAEMDEAFKRGTRKNAAESARKMLFDGMDMDLVVKYSGLSRVEVQALAGDK